MLDNPDVQVTPVVDGFVGKVSGLDLSSGADSDTAAFLTRTHADYPVLAIEGQSLDPGSFMAFVSCDPERAAAVEKILEALN